jgi:hypothetical protein
MSCSSASHASVTSMCQATISVHLPAFWTCRTPTWPTISSGMPFRKNPSSRGSRNSSPRLAFEIPPCRRARLAWALFGCLAAIALCFGFTQLAAWPLIAPVAVGLTLASLPALAVLWGRGPLAVRRIEWAPDGQWHLMRASGQFEVGRLNGATATLGPWILLAWTVGPGAWHPLRRRYALIGVSEVGAPTFRALKGRLSLLGGRRSGPVAP